TGSTKMNAPQVSTLSASGSKLRPKSLPQPYRRAREPSRETVAAGAREKRRGAHPTAKGGGEQRKRGRTEGAAVSWLGTLASADGRGVAVAMTHLVTRRALAARS